MASFLGGELTGKADTLFNIRESPSTHATLTHAVTLLRIYTFYFCLFLVCRISCTACLLWWNHLVSCNLPQTHVMGALPGFFYLARTTTILKYNISHGNFTGPYDSAEISLANKAVFIACSLINHKYVHQKENRAPFSCRVGITLGLLQIDLKTLGCAVGQKAETWPRRKNNHSDLKPGQAHWHPTPCPLTTWTPRHNTIVFGKTFKNKQRQ